MVNYDECDEWHGMRTLQTKFTHEKDSRQVSWALYSYDSSCNERCKYRIKCKINHEFSWFDGKSENDKIEHNMMCDDNTSMMEIESITVYITSLI